MLKDEVSSCRTEDSNDRNIINVIHIQLLNRS